MDINKVIKFVLYILAAFLFVWIMNTWNHDYPSKTNHTTKQSAPGQSSTNSFVPAASPVTSSKGTQASPVASQSVPAVHAVGSSDNHVVVGRAAQIQVKTDLYHIVISPLGGNLVQANLLKYPVSTKDPTVPVRILSPDSGSLYVAQAGLANAGNQNIVYHTVDNHYVMQPNQNTLSVLLRGQLKNGLRVEKVYTFTRGEYGIKLQFHVENASHKTWQGGFYHQIVRKNVPAAHPYLSHRSYSGGAISTKDKPYHQLSFKHMAENNLSQTVTGGWVAMQQPYFVTSWVPDAKTISEFYSHAVGGNDDGKNSVFTLGFVSTQLRLAPGRSAESTANFYIGPELASQLKKVSPSLTHTIDYGWLSPISVAIFWVMKKIFWVIGNWGWTIILITLLIKLIFYPLSNKSYKSMAKMRLAQPRIKALQERFGDDKQALGRATMEFYKKEKLNPMGGCLPMIIQIPVFFALYYVLIESVQLRQSPWIFWIHDLSMRDPYFILPVLMGASMFLQQRLSPPPPDPTQAKVMMLMPVVFTFLFLWFPAGLVLYWLTNNLLSVAHQWYIMKSFDPKKEQYVQREKARIKNNKKK